MRKQNLNSRQTKNGKNRRLGVVVTKVENDQLYFLMMHSKDDEGEKKDWRVFHTPYFVIDNDNPITVIKEKLKEQTQLDLTAIDQSRFKHENDKHVFELTVGSLNTSTEFYHIQLNTEEAAELKSEVEGVEVKWIPASALDFSKSSTEAKFEGRKFSDSTFQQMKHDYDAYQAALAKKEAERKAAEEEAKKIAESPTRTLLVFFDTTNNKLLARWATSAEEAAEKIAEVKPQNLGVNIPAHSDQLAKQYRWVFRAGENDLDHKFGELKPFADFKKANTDSGFINASEGQEKALLETIAASLAEEENPEAASDNEAVKKTIDGFKPNSIILNRTDGAEIAATSVIQRVAYSAEQKTTALKTTVEEAQQKAEQEARERQEKEARETAEREERERKEQEEQLEKAKAEEKRYSSHYKIIETTTHNHNCLGASMGEWLMANALAGNMKVSEWFGKEENLNKIKGPLKNALVEQNSDFSQFSNPSTEATVAEFFEIEEGKDFFTQLSKIPTKERQARVGQAMRDVLADIFIKGAEGDENLAKQLEKFEKKLEEAFRAYSQNQQPSYDDLRSLKGRLEEKFKALKEATTTKEQKLDALKTWWRTEGGRKAYGEALKKSTDFISEEHGRLLAAKFGLRFSYQSDQTDALTEVENGINDSALAMTLYHSTDHWSAYLPQVVVENYNAKHEQQENQLTFAAELEKKFEQAKEQRELSQMSVLSRSFAEKDFYQTISTYLSKTKTDTTLTKEALPRDYESYFSDANFNESEKTLTTNGFTLKFTSQKPLAPSNNTQDSEAKPVEILSIEATDYQKKAGENEPANKDDAELDAIAHAYALAFKANLKNPTDPLQIEITKFGKKWGRDKVRDAFIKAGFVRIKFEGETTYAHDKLEQVVKEQKESTERERAKVEAKRLEAGNPTPKEEVVNSNSSMLGGFFNDHALLTSAGVTTAMDTFLLSSLPPYLRYTGDAAIFLGANLLINESVRTALLQQLSRLNPFTPEAKETRELVATSAAGLSMAVGFAYLSSQLPAARNVLGDEAIWQGFSLSTLQNGAMAMPSAVFNFGFNALRMMAPKVLEQLASYGIDRFKMGSALQRHRVKQYLGYATSLAMLASGNYWGFAIGAGISSVVTAFNQEKREQFFEMFNQVDVLLHDVEVAPDNGKVLDGNKIIISEVADQENQYRISYVARNGAVTHHTLDPNSKSDLEKALIEQLKTTKFETFQSTALYDRTGVRGLAMAVVGEKNGKMGTPRFTVEDAKGFAKALPSKAKEGALTLVRPAWQASRQKVTDTWSSYTPNQQLGVSLTAAGAFLMASYFEGVLSGLAPDLTSGLTSGLVSKQWDAGSMQAFGFLALPVAAGLYTMHHDNQAQRAQEINSADGSVAQEAALIEAKKGTLAKGAAAFATTLVAENVLAYGGSFFSNPVAEQGVNLPDGEAITAFLGSMSSMMSNLSAFDSAGVLLPLLLLLVVGGSYMMMNKMFELQKSSAPAAPH